MPKTLPNQNTKNVYYFILSFLLFALTLSINFTKSKMSCAVVFTFLAMTVNIIAALYGSKRATTSIIICVDLSLITLYSKKYYIYGDLIPGLTVASLLSILVSSHLGLNFFLKLKPSYNFALRNFISLLLYGLIDALIMAIFFTSTFPMDRFFSIFFHEIREKYMIVFGVSVLLLKHWQKLLKYND